MEPRKRNGERGGSPATIYNACKYRCCVPLLSMDAWRRLCALVFIICLGLPLNPPRGFVCVVGAGVQVVGWPAGQQAGTKKRLVCVAMLNAPPTPHPCLSFSYTTNRNRPPGPHPLPDFSRVVFVIVIILIKKKKIFLQWESKNGRSGGVNPF